MPKRHPRQWVAYLSMSYYTTIAMMRNLATLAFGFLFPIGFVMVFGLLGGGSTKVTLGVPSQIDQNAPVVQTLKSVSVIKLKFDSNENLDKLLKQGKIDGEINITGTPGHQNVVLVTTNGNIAGAGAANSIVAGVVDQFNLRSAGVSNPPITLQKQEVSGREFRYIDFALPGMIGFSLLGTALFGTVFGFIALKRLLVLKRMFATPVRPLTILLAQGTSRLVIALLQTAVILGIGVFLLNFYLPHGLQTLAELCFISIVGLAAFMGFGLFFSGLAQDENSAGPLVNLISLPQFLLSGVFFPTDNFPAWVQPIANNLPLSYFNQAVRAVTTEGGTILDTWPYLLGLAAWGVVMYLLASRTFKWE